MNHIIDNKVYAINYVICKDRIFINAFYIKLDYRGRGYSKRIFYSLIRKYKMPVELECFPTLLLFYKKIGFKEIYRTVDGYIGMLLK